MSADECSSNESGWTTYIASPDHVDKHYDYDDDDDDEDDEDRIVDVREGDKQDVDSDDSMASDASSGPSDQYGHFNRHHGLVHKNVSKYDGKKQQQKDEKKQQEKAAKDKAHSAGKSKKR